MEDEMEVYAKTFEEYTNLIEAFVQKGLTFEAQATDGTGWTIKLTGGLLMDHCQSFNDIENQEEVPQKPVVRDTVKVGRNDPCPCGSGKKYKKCCN
jgi:uncharacterized protein YecA (UPF0149 family)